MRRYTDRLRLVAGRGTGPCLVTAGRRERRRPAEAAPLGQLCVWTTLFGPFTVGAWERQAPPRGIPSGTTPPAGRGGPGPFTPLRCPGFCEGSQAVTNPKGTLIFTRVLAAGRGSVLGLVTARSFGTRWRPVSRILGARGAALFRARYGTCLTRVREPGQRSRPTREASLGLSLPSPPPGGRGVGLPVARRTRWGGWLLARSRRIWRYTGTAPATDPLGLICLPASIWESRLRRSQCDAWRSTLSLHKEKPRRGSHPSPPIEPSTCVPMKREDFEDAVKLVLGAPLSDSQQRENREPTQEDLNQRFRLKQCK